MTGSATDPHLPGTTLLTIARLLCSEPVITAIIEPTLADLQSELAAAGPNRIKRVRARWRGYRAFWTVMFLAPFASWVAPARRATTVGIPTGVVPLVIGSIVFTVVAIANPVLGALVAVVTVAGALFAMLLHAWYRRHPADIPAPAERPWRSPQINFSSTEVAANSGGLIFVIGSVFVLAFGLPAVFWFLLAGTIAGGLVGRALVAWHTHHPQRDLAATRVVCR
jgi:hypothetical protein